LSLYNKLSLFKLIAFWTKANITANFLVEQCLSCVTFTVKQPSASTNPDNQASESKGVLFKGNLSIKIFFFSTYSIN